MSTLDKGPVKPKRGRKSKKTIAENALLEAAKISNTNLLINENMILDLNEKTDCLDTEDIELNLTTSLNEELDIEDSKDEKQVLKKRGRKPKGGKIIKQNTNLNTQKENKPNIILHLKCSLKDLDGIGDFNSNYTATNIDPYNFSLSKNDLNYELLNDKTDTNDSLFNNFHINSSSFIIQKFDKEEEKEKEKDDLDIHSNNNYVPESIVDNRDVWRKLKILEHNLHFNNISDKKSACFWCSYDFDNPPIYIPKHFIKDSYHVYGCFCSPECAVAHLMEENIDSSTKFERYHLINHIYSKIYDYKKNIKPAPHPHYMLEKFYGNLSIQEYRSLLKSERLFLIVDKPLTRILPEFHEDNDEFIIHNKIIPSSTYQVKKKIQKPMTQSKNNIVNEKFGISQTN